MCLLPIFWIHEEKYPDKAYRGTAFLVLKAGLVQLAVLQTSVLVHSYNQSTFVTAYSFSAISEWKESALPCEKADSGLP